MTKSMKIISIIKLKEIFLPSPRSWKSNICACLPLALCVLHQISTLWSNRPLDPQIMQHQKERERYGEREPTTQVKHDNRLIIIWHFYNHSFSPYHPQNHLKMEPPKNVFHITQKEYYSSAQRVIEVVLKIAHNSTIS